MTLAAASGWLKPEFEMLGVDYRERGSITDEYLEAMKILWTHERPSFRSRHVAFRGRRLRAQGAQKPHVPIWVAGGAGERPIKRLLQHGEGWMPMGGGLDDELRRTVVRVKDEIAAHGRDPASVTFRYTIGIGRVNAALASISKSISVGDPAALAPSQTPTALRAEFKARRFRRARFLWRVGCRVMEQLGWFGAEVMPLL